MSKIWAIVAREIREALPATIFFLLLFHLIAWTKAVSLNDFSLAALRAAGATVGALLAAKAILVVEALPVSGRFAARPAAHILWKTLLYSLMVFLLKILEEIIPLVSKHGGLAPAAQELYREVSWPLLVVLGLWIVGGLLFYCLAAELVRAVGPERVREILLGPRR